MNTQPYYSHTNESLPAIIAGLDIHQGDKILAVGGSGDQAIAMIGAGAIVVVSECSPIQLELIKERVRLIREGRWDEFFNIPFKGGTYDDIYRCSHNPAFAEFSLRRRAEYFGREGVREAITKNIEKLEVPEKTTNILEVTMRKGRKFSKFYYSNISLHSTLFPFRGLPLESLSYFSHDIVSNSSPPRGRSRKVEPFFTKVARDLEWNPVWNFWEPIVYRKVRKL